MLRSALAYLFQVKEWTAPLALYVGLTLLAVALAIPLAFRRGPPLFRWYMATVSVVALTQNSKLWGLAGEVILATATALFAGEILVLATRSIYGEERKWSRVTAVLLGAVGFSLLLIISPGPWPGYPASRYLLRLYSTAGGCATALGVWVWMRSQRKPVTRAAMWHAVIAVVWWLAILGYAVAIRKFHVSRWVAANSAAALQVACLVAWWIFNPGGRSGAQAPSISGQGQR